eukprot:14230053-Heterocapsa_arctica.AAC.1
MCIRDRGEPIAPMHVDQAGCDAKQKEILEKNIIGLQALLVEATKQLAEAKGPAAAGPAAAGSLPATAAAASSGAALSGPAAAEASLRLLLQARGQLDPRASERQERRATRRPRSRRRQTVLRQSGQRML